MKNSVSELRARRAARAAEKREQRTKRVKRMWAEGYSMFEIAQSTGIKESSVRYMLTSSMKG